MSKTLRQHAFPFLLAGLMVSAGLTVTGSHEQEIDALAPVEIVAEGFRQPTGIVVDPSGAVFVSDRKAGKVLKITGADVEPILTHLRHPAGLALDADGRLLIVEEGSGQLLRLEEDGRLAVLAEGLKRPRWVSVAEGGIIYLTAKGLRSHRDKKDDGGDEEGDQESGEVIVRLGSGGLSIFAGGFKGLQGLVIHGNSVFAVANGLRRGRDHGRRHEPGGVFQIPIQADGTAGPISRLSHTEIEEPVGLVLDGLGALYVSAKELESRRKVKDAIGKVAPDGSLTRFASKLEKPRGLAFDSFGNLYVADDKGGKQGRIIRFRAPPPPTLPFPSLTNQSPLTVHGTAEADSRIDASLNDSTSPTIITNQDGAFALSLDLLPNTQNFLDVFTTAHSGRGLTSAPAELTIVHDNVAPAISNLKPLNGSFLNTTTPLIQADFSDNLSGVDASRVVIRLDRIDVTSQVSISASGFTLPFNSLSRNPLPPLTEGPHTVLVSVSDRAGNSASALTTFTIDVTPPDTQIAGAPTGDIGETSATFAFTGTDNLTPVASLLFTWRLDGGPWSPFSSVASVMLSGLTEGAHLFEIKARDLAGNKDLTPAARSFTVSFRPVITRLDPSSGPIGTLVNIHGTGFRPGETQVAFNGTPAAIRALTTTLLTVTVPPGVQSGPVTVTTSKGTGTSREPFTAVTNQDFAISAQPGVGTVVQGTSTTYAVQLTSTGQEPFSSLATLSVGPLSPGVSATSSPSTVGSNGLAILTLTTASFTPVGSHAVEVQATAPVEGRPVTRTAMVTLAVQAPGETVLTGQVRDGDEQPLAGVSIKLGGSTITDLGTTDAGGNFFIPLSVTGPQIFLIDGSTLNSPIVNYSTIPVTLDIQPGVVNTLGFIPKLHAQPVAKLVPITPGQETVLTDPQIPGFQMVIPAGVQIIGWDGQPNTHISVTAIPVDRSPLPPIPSDQSSRQIYLFNFGKVGGGVPTGNVPIDTPNDVGGLPGDKVDLYYFNEAPDGTAPNQWEKYGTGTVSSDGSRIITDVNPATGLPFGIPRFCCGARLNVLPPSGGGPSGGPRDAGRPAGEPVDTATGFFYLDKTDIVLPGILPIAVTRTYRNQLTNEGPFGLGTSWLYDIFLQPPPNGSPDALILFSPGNRQDIFSRQPDGSFVNTSSPSLRGAVVTVASGLRSLRFKDGSLWRFDSAGRLISQTDRNGNTLTLTRDFQGRIAQITAPLGRQLTISYIVAELLQIHTIRDTLGRTVHYSYDLAGRLTSVTDPAGGITRYTYDAANRMTTITDPRGIVFLTNQYDSAGRVIRQTQADGGIWTFAYTTTGSYISQAVVTDPRGQTRTYRFNASGYIISETDALGQTMSFERHPVSNHVLSTTDPLGRVTLFTYDAAGNVTRITDPAGNVRTFSYEPTFNKLTSITDSLGNLTTFEYDAKGNLTATADPLGNRTTIAYNSFGQPISTTDPLGSTTHFEYDTVGNLTAVIDPLGNRSRREYDVVGRLVKQTDPRSKATSFEYDALNRLTKITDLAAGLTQFTYDGNGNLLTVTDARGSVITHTYDSMDRLATRTDPVGAVESFQYDPLGNLTRHTDRRGQINLFTYDALNRRIAGSYADGATTSFVYDAVGRLIQATDSVGGTIINQYDILDRLVAQITSLGTVSYQYDALSRRTQMDVVGQAPVTYSYGASSRLREITQGSQVVEIDYDPLGRRTQLMLPNGVSTEYHYDAASRLTALIYRNALGVLGDLTYQYDAAGNRIRVGGSFARTLLPDPVPSATYDAANRQLTFGDKAMTFDANGNLTSITDPTGFTAFTWDSRNQLVAMSGPTITTTFAYDALSRRVMKQVDSHLTQYQYDGIDIAQENIAGRNLSYLRTGTVDELLAKNDGIDVSVYLADALRSTLSLTGSSGALTGNYTYEPFGRAETTTADLNPFQFSGRENDRTGLYYFRYRYYDPMFGRFINEDPIGLLGRDLNFYVYVYNNPQIFIDPTGEIAQVVLTAAAGALSGLVGGAITGYASGDVPGAVAGAAVGFVAGGMVGAVNPWASYTMGAAAGNMAASAIGQVLGNVVNRQGPLCNFSVPAALGAGAASLIGGPVTQVLGGRAAVQVAQRIGATVEVGGVTTGIMVTGSVQAAQKFTEGVAGGVFSGLGELAGQRGEAALREMSNRLDGRKQRGKGCM